MLTCRDLLNSRANEIDCYIQFVEFCDDYSSSITTSSANQGISDDERNILRATVILHLYNLMEAVCVQMIKDICAAIHASKLSPNKAIAPIRATWLESRWKERRGLKQEKAVLIITEILEHVSKGRPIILDSQFIQSEL